METSGNQVDESVLEIGTLTVSEQGAKTRDAGEAQQGRDRIEGEHQQISRAGGGENHLKLYQLQEESSTLVKFAEYSAAIDRLERFLELRPNDIKAMLELANCYILLHEFDSAVDAARKIKESLLEQPKPKVHDLMLEAEKCAAVENYPGQLIFLWCACWLADGSQNDKAVAIGECLELMSTVGNDMVEQGDGRFTANDLDRLGTLLCRLSEDLEALIETLNDLDEDLLAKISIRCLSNKASGFVQQNRILESILVYESCVLKMRQHFGENAVKCVMVGEFLTMLGYLRISWGSDSKEGWKNMRDARTVLCNAEPTSAFEKHDQAVMLNTVDSILKFYFNAEEQSSVSEPDGNFQRKKKGKFASGFRTFLQIFRKRARQSSNSSA